MRKRKSLYLMVAVATLALFTGIIFSYGFSTGSVTLDVEKNNGNLNFEFAVKKGYGIQKDGPHEISVYTIDKKYAKNKNLGEILKEKGKLVQKFEAIKFTGETAKEDGKYFSKINPYSVALQENLETKNIKVVVSARVYYCSFADNFCSVESIREVLN
ncbi:MAG: hypothetical protein ABUK01_15080 [Leptospirales bacterium]